MKEEKKEFLLRLYDKLWENMYSKETRLWNYLSIYGAAIALVFATGKFAGIEVHATILILALTMWAVLIIINANWWYQRNLLMVTRVEEQFEDAVRGVIPAFYRDPSFRFDRLYRGSMVVLVTIAVLVYAWTMSQYSSPGSIKTLVVLITLGLVYVLFILAVGYCLIQHESCVPRYYQAKLELLSEARKEELRLKKNSKAKQNMNSNDEKTEQVIRADLWPKELKARWAVGCRYKSLSIFVIVAVLFNIVLKYNTRGHDLFTYLAISLQIVALILYWWLARAYYRGDLPLSAAGKYHLSISKPAGSNWWRSSAIMPHIMLALAIVSAALFVWGVLASGGMLDAVSAEAEHHVRFWR